MSSYINKETESNVNESSIINQKQNSSEHMNNNNILTNNVNDDENNNNNNIEEYYIKKLEDQQKQYYIMASKKDKEIEEFFSQIEQENSSLKRELIQLKLELEEEKSKTQNMKETYFNINSFDESNPELDRIVFENIKYIKEENEKKLQEISDSYSNQLASSKKEYESLKHKIKTSLDSIDLRTSINLTDINDNVTSIIDVLGNKISSLIEDNFNKEKYVLMLNQKYDLATEENNFLKNKILQEKTLICEQIADLQKQTLNSHFELEQTLLNELNEKKSNFFNKKFNDSFDEVSSYLKETIDINKKLLEQNEFLKVELEEMKLKLDIAIKEKDSLLTESKNIIVNSYFEVLMSVLNLNEVLNFYMFLFARLVICFLNLIRLIVFLMI